MAVCHAAPQLIFLVPRHFLQPKQTEQSQVSSLMTQLSELIQGTAAAEPLNTAENPPEVITTVVDQTQDPAQEEAVATLVENTELKEVLTSRTVAVEEIQEQVPENPPVVNSDVKINEVEKVEAENAINNTPLLNEPVLETRTIVEPVLETRTIVEPVSETRTPIKPVPSAIKIHEEPVPQVAEANQDIIAQVPVLFNTEKPATDSIKRLELGALALPQHLLPLTPRQLVEETLAKSQAKAESIPLVSEPVVAFECLMMVRLISFISIEILSCVIKPIHSF